MTDRPIIFSGPMVRALLEGRKTMTRRVIKPQPTSVGDKVDAVLSFRIGDSLYVRENFHEQSVGGVITDCIQYQANEQILFLSKDGWRLDPLGDLMRAKKWRPSIHMPKAWSRLTLTVTAVKVERLQDISEGDAIAEGIKEDDGSEPDIFYLPGSWTISGVNAPKGNLPIGQYSDPRLVFRDLWNNLNAKRAPWESNPWVVAPTFTVHKCNIERMAA